jgi:xanthine dehydrogenase YagR molybdenum-binding subunit
MRHDTVAAGAFVGEHIEAADWDSHPLYAWPAFSTTHRLVRLDRSSPAAIRSPFGGLGFVAVEIAMDELAYELHMDPSISGARANADIDPSDGLPFSSKKLRECYDEGARRFGWSNRPFASRSMRDGRNLVGYGMATALLRALRFPAQARVSIDRPGQVRVETSTQDVGQGVSTVLPQIAADVLGPRSSGNCAAQASRESAGLRILHARHGT